MRYAFDPGCFRPPGSEPHDALAREVALALGVTLEEVDEPGACAAPGLEMNGIPAWVRVGRLLTRAARQLAGRPDARVPPTFVTPCSACFLSLSRASRTLETHADLRRTVTEELAASGVAFEAGPVLVRHLLDVVGADAGPDALRSRVRKPLAGLRVAPYYGCLAQREGAPESAGAGRAEPPYLEEILSAIGAEPVDFPLKAHCCGGRAAQASEETATSLHVRILRSATSNGADVIAVACPRCETGLSAGQDAVNRRYGTRFAIPVRYFTDLVAEAFGLPRVPSRASKGVTSVLRERGKRT